MHNFLDKFRKIFGKLPSLEGNWIMKKSWINGKFEGKKAEIPGRISCLLRITSWRFHQIVREKNPTSAAVFSVPAHTKRFKIGNKHYVH